jgi:hypothetical protein
MENIKNRLGVWGMRPEVHDGQKLATSLGWPAESMGFFGASSAMVDLGASCRQLDSMLTVVKRRQDHADACVRHAMEGTIAARLPSRDDD